MLDENKDLTEIYIGEGSFSKNPVLTSKKISYAELNAILQESTEICSENFCIQRKKLTFAFPNNRGKGWLRTIKETLLQNTAEEGRKMYPSLYQFSRGSVQKIKGRLFVRTKFASEFSSKDLQKIGETILKRFVFLPQKFCSFDARIELNDEISVEPARFLHHEFSGDGFYIHFSVSCQLKKIMTLKPIGYFEEKRFLGYISQWGHYTCGRNGLLRIVCYLLEYGNKLVEIPVNRELGWRGYQTMAYYQKSDAETLS